MPFPALHPADFKKKVQTRAHSVKQPAEVVEKTAVKNLSVSMPIFAIGFKEEIKTPSRTLKESVESNLLLDIIAGKTSSLYEKLLGEGLSEGYDDRLKRLLVEGLILILGVVTLQDTEWNSEVPQNLLIYKFKSRLIYQRYGSWKWSKL